MSSYSFRSHPVQVTPSAVGELVNVMFQLGRDFQKVTYPWRKHIDTHRPDLVRKVRAFWDADSQVPRAEELYWIAGYTGYIPGDDPEPFFNRFDELVTMAIKDKAMLPKAGWPSQEETASRLQRIEALLDPKVRQNYVALLRDLWDELAPIWERDGLPIVQLECSRLRQRLDEGADLFELLPAKHFLQFEEYAERVRKALDEDEPLVVIPMHFAGGGFLLDLGVAGLPLHLGYNSRYEGVHQVTAQKAAELAARLKAFSDPTRLTLLSTIGELDVTVGDLAKLLEITQPSVSGHLKVLQTAGLVTVRKKGVKSFYRADSEAIENLLKETWDLLR